MGLRDQEVTLFKEDFTCSSFNTDGTFDHPIVTTTYTLAESSYKKNTRILQDKKYELTNHLGNVVAVITAYKIPVPVSSPTDLTVSYYKPDVVSYSDYYGFGMMMPGRNGNSGDYRYGFQGQEKDDEIKGTGNSYSYEYRFNDPRLGRFLSIDPLAGKYPYYSPYSFSGNRVIDMMELEGLEPVDPENKFEVVKDHGNDYYKDEGISGNLSYVREKETGNEMYLFSRKNENGSYTMMTNPGGPNGAWSEYNMEGYLVNGIIPTEGPTQEEINRGKALQYLLETARQWKEHDFAGKFGAVVEFTILTAMTFGLAPEASFISSAVRTEVSVTTETSVATEVSLTAEATAPAIQTAEVVAPRTISSMSGHAVNQAITRGFKPADILKIIKEGVPTLGKSKFGVSQWRYMLNGNTVIVNAEKGRVITIFSNAPGSKNGLGAGVINVFK